MPSPKPPQSLPHIIALDGIRGLAILAVLVGHIAVSVSARLPEGWAIATIRLGLWGVDVFFVLSGFLITAILLDTVGSPGYYSRFLSRRMLRIAPLYAVFLALIFLVFPALNWTNAPDHWASICFWFSNLLSDRGALQPLTNHLWSLAVEEQFYFLWPFAILFIPVRRVGLAALAIAAGSLALRLVAWHQGRWEETLHRFTPMTLDPIALGCWLAWFNQRHPDRFARLARIAPFVAAGSFLALLGLGLSRVSFLSLIAFGRLPAGLLGAALVVIAKCGLWHPVLTGRFLVYCGRRCYGLYLLHVIPLMGVAWWLKDRVGSWALVFESAAMLGASFLLAEISWRCLEGPAQTLKRFLPYHSPDSRTLAVDFNPFETNEGYVR